MHTFVLPQRLLNPGVQKVLEEMADSLWGVARSPGWTVGGPNVEGWTFPEAAPQADGPEHRCPLAVARLFHRHAIAWVEAPIDLHRGEARPHFWPVVWYHHDSDGVLHAERCVLDQARRWGWFASPYRHTPTAHATLAAQTTPVRHLPPFSSIS